MEGREKAMKGLARILKAVRTCFVAALVVLCLLQTPLGFITAAPSQPLVSVIVQADDLGSAVAAIPAGSASSEQARSRGSRRLFGFCTMEIPTPLPISSPPLCGVAYRIGLVTAAGDLCCWGAPGSPIGPKMYMWIRMGCGAWSGL